MSQNFISGIASQSLGLPQQHDLRGKLEAAGSVGLKSVEIFEDDIAVLHEQASKNQEIIHSDLLSSPNDDENLDSNDKLRLACARQIRRWCQTFGLDIICLQPFKNFEGLTDRTQYQQRLRKLHLWILTAENLGTDLIQIPSNFLSAETCTSNRDTLISDLRTAADMGLARTPTIRFAHEALCFGTHTNTWDAAWSLVQAVDRPNFGTCIDTFNLAGRTYADPAAPSGCTPNAQANINQSVQKLRDTFADSANLAKLFYVELCDGERLTKPLGPSHPWYNPEQTARMTWSRNARLFPFETDTAHPIAPGVGPGYLPIMQIFDAILDVGYQGYVSFEVFSRTLHEEGDHVVKEHAERARVSWERCERYIDAYFQEKQESNEHQADLGADLGDEGVDGLTGVSGLRGGGVSDDFAIQPRL